MSLAHIACHVHPNIAAIDCCFNCGEAICVTCKRWVPTVSTSAVYNSASTVVLVGCATCYNSFSENVKQSINSFKKDLFEKKDSCTIQ